MSKVLLSTDIGTDIDDAVALYLAMNSPTIDLKGVYVTNGPVETRAKIAARMIRLGYSDALVALGEANAMDPTAPLHHTTGMESFSVPGNDKRKTLQGLDVVVDWMDAMTRQLEEFADVVVASIAPLTNIARLLEKKPDSAAKIKSLYIMGGREGEREHNFTHDALAAQKVLESDLEMVIIPADVCGGHLVQMKDLTGLRGSSLQSYLANMAMLWKLHHDSREFSRFGKTREVFKNKTLGYFRGEKLFYNMVELLARAKVTEDPYGYQRLFSMFKSARILHGDVPKVCEFLDEIEEKQLKSTRVSDAFVIYAIEHPERVKEKRVTLETDEHGIMTTRKGEKHRLIVDVDYRHFARYLKERLDKKPEKRKKAKV